MREISQTEPRVKLMLVQDSCVDAYWLPYCCYLCYTVPFNQRDNRKHPENAVQAAG